MPAYFELEMMFTRERLKSGFVKDIYQHLIEAGFDFLGRHGWNRFKGIIIETTLDEITNWNQACLEDNIHHSSSIISESVYKKFSKDYFKTFQTTKILNNGILIE